jgi:hypothetical protein
MEIIENENRTARNTVLKRKHRIFQQRSVKIQTLKVRFDTDKDSKYVR